MPAVTKEAHKTGDHLVDYEAKAFEDVKAKPGDKALVPGWPYQGPNPDGFMLRDEIVDYLDGFTASFDPPLREGTSVTRVTPVPEGCCVETTSGIWTTGQVVVATGGCDRPIIPPYADAIAPQIMQMHSVSTTAGCPNCPKAAR